MTTTGSGDNDDGCSGSSSCFDNNTAQVAASVAASPLEDGDHDDGEEQPVNATPSTPHVIHRDNNNDDGSGDGGALNVSRRISGDEDESLDADDIGTEGYSKNNISLTHEEFELWIKEELRLYCCRDKCNKKKKGEEGNPDHDHDDLYKLYPKIMDSIPEVITKWRKRYDGNPKVWKRIFTLSRVLKEIIEALPIIHAVEQFIQYNYNNPTTSNGDTNHADTTETNTKPKAIIIDLCSGKGYLSMFLSEYLPKEHVEKFVLIDKQWPMCSRGSGRGSRSGDGGGGDDSNNKTPPPPTSSNNSSSSSSHINWEHIYGYHPQRDATGDNGSGYYFHSWPIPLHTSKQDLKKSRTKRLVQEKIFDNGNGDGNHHQPIILLAVHLCGTLSMKAIEWFNELQLEDFVSRGDDSKNHNNGNTNVPFLALKPCCLPDYRLRKRTFQLGYHTFQASEVCSQGKWNHNQWVNCCYDNANDNDNGNRAKTKSMKSKFDLWVNHLYRGIITTNAPSPITTTLTTTGEEGTEDSIATAEEGGGDNVVKLVQKRILQVKVQVHGGHQNSFIFAERCPITPTVWEGISTGI